MLSIVEWVMGYTIHHAELRYFVKELYLHPGIFFLTYRDGVNYLEKYESKYDKDVRLYAMSPKDLFTDCSPEIKKLFDILHTVVSAKKIEKFIFLEKFLGQMIIWNDFAAAEKKFSEQGMKL